MKDYTEGHPNDKQFDNQTTVIDKIQSKLDHLRMSMEGQLHIDRPDYTNDLIESITKFWSVLKEDDREYVEAAKYALVNKMSWDS
jgi:hypothetical protein